MANGRRATRNGDAASKLTVGEILLRLPAWIIAIGLGVFVITIIGSLILNRPIYIWDKKFGVGIGETLDPAGSEIAAWVMVTDNGEKWKGKNIREVSTNEAIPGQYTITFEKALSRPYFAMASGKYYDARIIQDNAASVVIETVDLSTSPPTVTKGAQFRLLVLQGGADGNWK